MGCFPCFKIKKERSNKEVPDAQPRDTISPSPQPHPSPQSRPSPVANKNTPKADDYAHKGITEDGNSSAAKAFTFRELATATKHFRKECLLSESGIGRVFKGTLQSNGQVVVVRQLDRSATQGSKEFAEEVLMLSQLHHRNLVKMIGYCADGDQRMLVHEYVPNGTLENHLFDLSKDKKPLDWLSRMKIALGITEGLAYLHGEANPPIIYRSLKTSNVLLDNDYTPKLSEYGLATLLQSGNNLHAAPTVMSAYGYCAPECEMQGNATSKSDVYSFGVVLLELITGRRAYDDEKATHEQILVVWAKPFFSDPKKFPEMADPLLKNRFPTTSINQAVGVASMCTQEEPSVRPLITDVVDALSFLAMAPPEAPIPSHLVPILSGKITPSPSQRDDDNNNSH